jgi:hypothetical protein
MAIEARISRHASIRVPLPLREVARRGCLALKLPLQNRYRLPSLALAQLLHHDAGRAEELETLNDAPHPAFMPRAGYQLVP